MSLLIERYHTQIEGVLSCYDRIVINGTLPQLCYAQGMTSYLYFHNIRIFDYPKLAEPLRDELRLNAERIAKANGIEIEFVAKKHIRKEDLVKKVLDRRGNAAGLVHILSAMETCESYQAWHDKRTHKTYLKAKQGKCLHYYFYFIDEDLGLCYVRVPTWCPFKLQIYFNGHNWLASKLKKKKIGYSLLDNAFDHITDYERAQQLSNGLSVEQLHKKLDEFAQRYCPVHAHFEQVYHWSIMQVEYATDIVFKKQADLQWIYDQLIRTAIHTVKPDNIATFLGRKLHGNYQGEVGNNYHVRVEGTRIKHSMAKVSIKMYDKHKKILRIETTANDISFFKHYRTVEHKDGTTSPQNASMKKNIYSLAPLRKIMTASNKRYLEFISAIDDQKTGRENLKRVSQPIKKNNRNYKGFNFFNHQDLELLLIIARGEFNVYGFQNKNIRKFLKHKNSGQVSRLIKRLYEHRLIRKIKNSYKYYLTNLGKQIILTALKIKELIIVPQLNTSK
jgi:DNA-binding transcriptional MerR regulator